MNYIVFDLEWNQSPGGKKYSNSRLPFEIIEIGAVKMNEQREVVDVFQRLVKPQVYNWIHDSIHEVIHVDYKDLADGVPFQQAVSSLKIHGFPRAPRPTMTKSQPVSSIILMADVPSTTSPFPITGILTASFTALICDQSAEPV